MGNFMASTYLGFDLGHMLFWLSQYCEDVSINKEEPGIFRLTVFSDEHGEYENTGSLFSITTQAFKPFAERAKKDKEEFSLKFWPALKYH
jgi:hypothetical protein